MECLSGWLARWSATPPSLSSLADRLVMSTRYMAYGFSLGLCMVRACRNYCDHSHSTQGEQKRQTKNDGRQTTDEQRETERQTTQVSTPTPAAFLCFTCRLVFLVLTWFAFWTPRSEPSSHQTVNMKVECGYKAQLPKWRCRAVEQAYIRVDGISFRDCGDLNKFL